MNEPDWTHWRSFAAVVEHGSLSGAARHLGMTQPTMGRHIEELERTLGVTLFDRTLQGLKPTETGLRLYEPIRAAQQSLAQATLMAEGTHEDLNGSIRITSSNVTCHYVLPPMLLGLRRDFPGIDIELVSSDSVENLLLREADIAIRMFRPTQLDLVTRKLGTIPIVATAPESYLARRGYPTSPADLREHDLVGFDRSELFIQGARQLGFELSRTDFALRTDSQTVIWEMVRAGLGISFAQGGLVRETPGMVELFPGFGPPPLEVWLTTHRELFTSRRIRAIYDRLGEDFTRYLARINS